MHLTNIVNVMKLIIEYVKTYPDSDLTHHFNYLHTMPFEYSSSNELKELIELRVKKFLKTRKWGNGDRYISSAGYHLDLCEFITHEREYEEPDIFTIHEYFKNAKDLR